jgi:DNA-directed RNA polymerase omega subunit
MVEQAKETAEATNASNADIPEIDSKYRKIILAAQRSKQIQRGAMPRIEMDLRQHKPTRIAMKELDMGVIKFDVTKDKKTS